MRLSALGSSIFRSVSFLDWVGCLLNGVKRQMQKKGSLIDQCAGLFLFGSGLEGCHDIGKVESRDRSLGDDRRDDSFPRPAVDSVLGDSELFGKCLWGQFHFQLWMSVLSAALERW